MKREPTTMRSAQGRRHDYHIALEDLRRFLCEFDACLTVDVLDVLDTRGLLASYETLWEQLDHILARVHGAPLSEIECEIHQVADGWETFERDLERLGLLAEERPDVEASHAAVQSRAPVDLKGRPVLRAFSRAWRHTEAWLRWVLISHG